MSSGRGGPSARAGKGAPYAHFDDIKRPLIEVSLDTPVDKLLQYGSDCIKQAEFQRTYGRPDRALQEYIKASTVLIEILPYSPAWASAASSHPTTKARYDKLLGQIGAADAEYTKIKNMIKEDNLRSGVKPRTAGTNTSFKTSSSTGTGTGTTNGHRAAKSHDFANGALNGLPTAPTTAPGTKATKPAVQPKPQALHGNAVKSTQDRLAERFANLRPAQPVQDPRIRTQPINHPSFQQLTLQTSMSTPTSMPQQVQTQTQTQIYQQFQNFQKSFESLPASTASASNTPLMHELPDLPKVPDAIYNPARGSVSSPAAQTPTGVVGRGKFSRTNSVNSFSGGNKTPSQATAPSEDYFSLMSMSSSRQPSRPSQDSTRPARKPVRVPVPVPGPVPVSVPEGDTVTAPELFKLMQAGARQVQLLLVDIRSRSEYDEGHIMSQATVCVDADILQRPDISGDQIAESMVLAPTAEAQLFDKRAEADVVVFYDANSETIPGRTQATTTTQKAVVAFYNALAYYDYRATGDGDNNGSSSSSSKKPKLLRGGIEAWISLMGPHSLQTSSTAAAFAQRPRRATFVRPQAKYKMKPIQDAAEAKRWEESLKDMESSAFVRTTDDFLRRFPPASAIQESMTSGETSSGAEGQQPEAEDEQPKFRITKTLTKLPPPPPLTPSLPPPPTRPAPTVPRQTHNDVPETDEDDHYLRTKLAKAGAAAGGGGAGRMRRHKVGLDNPGNWCYGNSSFQSLFASGAFADELTTRAWLSNWKVPMKADEKIRQPQLLAKILGDSFYWMQFGKFAAMKAKTLMEYCYHIHSRDYDGSLKSDRSMIFGGPSQQDAQEFISFLLENLHDETNRLRDRTGEVQQPALDAHSTALSNGLRYWQAYRQYNDSLVDKYWRGVEVTDRRCRACGHPSLTYEHFDTLHLPIPPGTAGTSTATTITDLLAQYCGADTLTDYRCDHCRRINSTEKRVRLVRLPDLLCISFRRFQGNEHYGFHKNNAAVLFPINGLDMTPFSVQARTAPADQTDGRTTPDEHQFRAPFVYDCYAVIVHSGTLRSGHYRAFVKDEGAADTSQWHHFDDARIEPVIIGSNDSRDMAKRLYRDNSHGGASAYMVFYKRRV